VLVREPTTEIRTCEIIRDITNVLKPYRNRLDGRHWQEDEVSEWWAKQIRLLRDVVPQHFTRKAIRRTRADARSIIKTVKLLQGQIKNAAPELHLRWKSDLLKPSISEPSDMGEDVQTALFSTASPRLSELLAELNWLSDICAEADDAKADTTDQCKRQCVHTALISIGVFSQSPATIEGSGTISGWLYEAVTGIKDKDFRYLCQQMIKRFKP
jgi:hypothetical protein